MPRFDAAYYDRFYHSPRSRVQGPREVARLCTVVTNIVEATHGPIETVLEIGAGPGLWRDWFAARRPKTRYRSTDVSAYACRQYGHERRDIARWKARQKFDLVVCQGVLPYLDDTACGKALENIAAMTGGFLYLEAITKNDIDEVIDDAKTDVKVFGRTGTWYRKRLEKYFVEVGCGLWAKKDAPVLFYELERR